MEKGEENKKIEERYKPKDKISVICEVLNFQIRNQMEQLEQFKANIENCEVMISKVASGEVLQVNQSSAGSGVLASSSAQPTNLFGLFNLTFISQVYNDTKQPSPAQMPYIVRSKTNFEYKDQVKTNDIVFNMQFVAMNNISKGFISFNQHGAQLSHKINSNKFLSTNLMINDNGHEFNSNEEEQCKMLKDTLNSSTKIKKAFNEIDTEQKSFLKIEKIVEYLNKELDSYGIEVNMDQLNMILIQIKINKDEECDSLSIDIDHFGHLYNIYAIQTFFMMMNINIIDQEKLRNNVGKLEKLLGIKLVNLPKLNRCIMDKMQNQDPILFNHYQINQLFNTQKDISADEVLELKQIEFYQVESKEIQKFVGKNLQWFNLKVAMSQEDQESMIQSKLHELVEMDQAVSVSQQVDIWLQLLEQNDYFTTQLDTILDQLSISETNLVEGEQLRRLVAGSHLLLALLQAFRNHNPHAGIVFTREEWRCALPQLRSLHFGPEDAEAFFDWLDADRNDTGSLGILLGQLLHYYLDHYQDHSNLLSLQVHNVHNHLLQGYLYSQVRGFRQYLNVKDGLLHQGPKNDLFQIRVLKN